jgi:integrase
MAKRRPSGDGMVRKREDGRWEGRIVVGHKKNGTPIFQHAYAHTQKELTEKLHQNIERYQDVELTEDSRMTLGEWLDRWLTEYKAGTVRPGTLKSYRCYIEYYIKPQLGDKQISLISQQDIQRMYRRLKTEGRIHEHPEMNHQLSDSMVRHIHSALHAALKDAVQAHVIPRNPTEGATAPKPNYRPKRILTRAELDAFLEVVEQDEVWRDFFQTELMTGLRRGEICGLQWNDFDEDTGTLKVCRTLHSQRKGEYTVGETKTGKGMRTILLPKTVADILRRRKADTISQWIFPDPVKPEDPVNPGSAYLPMKTLLRRAGLPSIRFHDLRQHLRLPVLCIIVVAVVNMAHLAVDRARADAAFIKASAQLAAVGQGKGRAVHQRHRHEHYGEQKGCRLGPEAARPIIPFHVEGPPFYTPGPTRPSGSAARRG